MTESLRSTAWYRVSELRPRLRSHVTFHRHSYRGERWYVLHDPTTQRSHRLAPPAYFLAGLMDGEHSVNAIWEAAQQQLGEESPTQDEAIRLLSLLHHADLLQSNVPSDTVELLARSRRTEDAEARRRFSNPLSIRIPLVDPDRLLEAWLPVARVVFSLPMLAIFAALVVAATVLAVLHWDAIEAVGPRTLMEPRTLLLLWIVYPVVKAIHELGHAFAAKVWGAEIHDMGVIFLVLMPVPYVDASSASTFPEKSRRALVGAAGIGVELLLAALAFFVWLAVEPGLVRTLAFVTMTVGGASTLFFNGNPLLRFDGYYVFADWIEIPNLYERSRRYLGYLAQRWLLGIRRVRNPVTTPSERYWLAGYGIAAFCYRLAVLVAIASFLAEFVPVLGVALAVFALIQQLVVPIFRQVRFLLTAPWIGEQRARAVSIAAIGLLAASLIVAAVPVPSASRAQGVVWPPEEAMVRARGEGFVVALAAQPGQRVLPGDALVEMYDPDLDAELEVLAARLAELEAREYAERGRDRVRAQITRQEMAAVTAELDDARIRSREVVLRSPTHGTFVLPDGTDLLGRHLQEGALVGYVIGDEIDTVRVVVDQAQVARIRDDTQRVRIRVPGAAPVTLPGDLGRQTPAASYTLPHAALGAMGGGRVSVDPSDEAGRQTLDPVFELEVSVVERTALREIGRRVFVRFEHSAEPLARQLTRALHGLFLRHVGA